MKNLTGLAFSLRSLGNRQGCFPLKRRLATHKSTLPQEPIMTTFNRYFLAGLVSLTLNSLATADEP
ncbi:MAG: hypothetical protein AB7I48_22935, partial [Planctomycetaceae bacterium]